MTNEGGTNSNFSPFRMLVRATSPLSPTSTFSMAIFCGGRPDSDSHFCSAEAFSSESISQPHGIGCGEAVVRAVSLLLVEIEEQRILVLRERGRVWIEEVLRGGVVGFWEKVGRSVVWKILEVSAIEERENLICWAEGEESEVSKECLVVLTVVNEYSKVHTSTAGVNFSIST